MVQLWAMSPLRHWTMMFFLAAGPLLHAQERPEGVSRELQAVASTLRTQPPEVALRRMDSLLALPPAAQHPLLRMGLHYYRGHALRLLGRQDEALEAHTRAYAMADSLDDHKGRIDARIAISLIHMDLGQLDKAHRELLDIHARTQARPTERNYRIGLLLGHLCELQGRRDSALHWFTLAQGPAEAAHDSTALCEILFNKGLIHRDLHDAVRSEEHLLAALAHLPRAGYPQLEGRVHQTLASLYLQQRRFAEVPARLDRAYRIAQEHRAGDALLDVMADRTAYHLAVGDTAAALANSDRLMAVKDSLGTLLREKALADAEARFGVTRMEKELALMKAEAEVNALRAQRSWIAWGALAVISVLAAILIFNFRKQYLAKKKAAQALEQDKDRLTEENEFLHQENLMARFETLKSQIDPHFLFNAMNTLYTLVETEPKKAREFVSSFSALYRKVLTSRERTIVPVKEVVRLAHAKGIPVLVDGSQGAVHLPVDVQDIDCDFYVCTGHKL